MNLNNRELHKLLKRKGINKLYHANSVATSITYLEQGGLLSRANVENKGLFQTVQSSDPIDKIFGVWADVFLDTTDLHNTFCRQNLYGPVCFEFDVDFLLTEKYSIWVTKDNPIRWKSTMKNDEKYFVDVNELESNWNETLIYQKMITIREMEYPILFPYLEQITIDHPGVKLDDVSLYKGMLASLEECDISNPKLLNKIKKRSCNKCYCKDNYLNQVSRKDLERLFYKSAKLKK